MKSKKNQIINYIVCSIVILILSISIIKTNSLFAANMLAVPNVGYNFSEKSVTIGKNETIELETNFIDSEIADTDISFEFTNPNVAKTAEIYKINIPRTPYRQIVIKIKGSNSGSTKFISKIKYGKSIFTATCKVTVKDEPNTVLLSKSNVTIGKGETIVLSENTNSGTYANADNLRWSSSNSNVASIIKKDGTNKAVVTGIKTGSTQITLKLYNGKTATCKVTVKEEPNSVSLSKNNLTIGKGETIILSENTNSGTYANADNLRWSSSNSNVVSIKKNEGTNKAVIKGINTGSAIISLELYNGKTATCTITVKDAPNSVSLSKSSFTLGMGETIVLSENTNSGTYANADNLRWSSSNPNVARVMKKAGTNKAVVTGINTGSAIISLELYNGKTATCTVVVKNAPTSISLTAKNIKIGKMETITLAESTNSGSYANVDNLVWTNGNPKVLKVNKKAGTNQVTIRGENIGRGVVLVRTYNGLVATCVVTVKNAPMDVKLNVHELKIKVGDTFTLHENTDDDSYANSKNLLWTNSDPNIISIKKKEGTNRAIITALKEGVSTVTIRTYNDKTDVCKVTVEKYNGKTRAELIKVIKQQIGKTGEDCQSYYGAGRSADWCCYFLGYCIDKVLGKGAAMKKFGFVDSDYGINEAAYGSDAGDIARAAERSDTKIVMHRYGDGYIPQAGDIFIMCERDDWRTHVGFIKEVKKDKDGNVIQYKTIEGNANSNSAEAATVDEFTRTYDTKNGYRIDTHIYGFIDVGFYFK